MPDPAEQLLDHARLEQSGVAANLFMQRGRGLDGRWGYSRELGVDIRGLLAERLAAGRRVAWLDLCCGQGRALIEAWGRFRKEAARLELVGVDLLPGSFDPLPADAAGLRLRSASLHRWEPGRRFDLITCVHGLHYIGDKLALLRRALGWLTEDGVFAAHLDLANLRFADGRRMSRALLPLLRAAGVDYVRGRRVLRCRGPRTLRFPFRYLGADTAAGPNFTGQPAVCSVYG